VTFSNLTPADGTVAGGAATVFGGTVQSPTPIEKVELWSNWNGSPAGIVSMVPPRQGVELLKNGSLDGISGGVATDWSIVSDGVTPYAATGETGVSGLAQKIAITGAGSWGLFLHQAHQLDLNVDYQWTFWYKTSGNNGIQAEVANGPLTEADIVQPLPGTNGVWRQAAVTFRHGNIWANQLRIYTREVGTVWVDAMALRSALGSYPTTVNAVLPAMVPGGTHQWQLRATNGSGTHAGPSLTLTAPGGSSASLEPASLEAMQDAANLVTGSIVGMPWLLPPLP
jgi:hypothetical protein